MFSSWKSSNCINFSSVNTLGFCIAIVLCQYLNNLTLMFVGAFCSSSDANAARTVSQFKCLAFIEYIYGSHFWFCLSMWALHTEHTHISLVHANRNKAAYNVLPVEKFWHTEHSAKKPQWFLRKMDSSDHVINKIKSKIKMKWT